MNFLSAVLKKAKAALLLAGAVAGGMMTAPAMSQIVATTSGAASFSQVALGQALTLGLNVFVTGVAPYTPSTTSLQPTGTVAGNSTLIKGNLGVAGGANESFSGSGRLVGQIIKDTTPNGGTVTLPASFTVTANPKILNTQLDTAVNDVTNAEIFANQLTATQTRSTINLSGTGASGMLTIAATAANRQNVVNITNGLTLTGGAKLTLQGTAADYFIINVKSGNFSVSNSSILLAGGITPNNVLFTDYSGNVSITGATSVVNGTILDVGIGTLATSGRDKGKITAVTGGKITLTDGTVNGGLIGYDVDINNGKINNLQANGTGTLFRSVTPIPEPATTGMLLSGLGLLGFVARRRSKATV